MASIKISIIPNHILDLTKLEEHDISSASPMQRITFNATSQEADSAAKVIFEAGINRYEVPNRACPYSDQSKRNRWCSHAGPLTATVTETKSYNRLSLYGLHTSINMKHGQRPELQNIKDLGEEAVKGYVAYIDDDDHQLTSDWERIFFHKSDNRQRYCILFRYKGKTVIYTTHDQIYFAHVEQAEPVQQDGGVLLKPKKTTKQCFIEGRNRLIYVGKHGKQFIKMKNEYIALSQLKSSNHK